MRKNPALWLSLLGLAASYLALASRPALPTADRPYLAGRTPLVIAHRGGKGLWPENTLYAFERAAKLGVDVVEMDVRASSDGVLVVLHDSSVDRTTGGHGRMAEKTLSEVKALDAGYRWSDDDRRHPYRDHGIVVPTLEEVFRALPAMRLNLEIKEPSATVAASLCELVRRCGMADRVLVGSFHAAAIEALRRSCPEVATAATAGEVRGFYAANLLRLPVLFRPAAQVFEVPERFRGLPVVTERFVSEAHRRGMQVQVFTVNEIGDMKRLLNLGVDGILTDYPDRLLEFVGRSQPVAGTN